MGTRAHYWDHVLDPDGEPIVGATVNVYNQDTTTPITPTIFAGDTGDATTQTNPLETDSSGKYEIWLDDPLRCDVKVSKGTEFNAYTETIDVSPTGKDGADGAPGPAGADGQDGTISLLRDGGVDQTQRGKMNFVDTADITFTLTDDAANDETEVTASFAADMATQAELDAHTGDATDAHDASAVSFAPAGTIAATDVQAAIEEVASEAGGGGGATVVRKTADESVTSSTTLQNDNHLTFAIAANEVWVFEAFLVVGLGDEAADIKVAFTVPTGATLLWGGHGATDSTTGPNSASMELRTVSTSGGARVYGIDDFEATTILIRGTVVNGATAGSLTLQWAQNASSATATVVKANSHLIAHEVA